MGTAQDYFLNLYKHDKAYRGWFKRWWAADFSHTGRTRRHQTVGHIAGGEFAGRTWTRGWAPPHDLEGRPNDAFVWLTQGSTRQHWWQHIRGDLAGSFLNELGPNALSASSSGLEFCFFEGDLVYDPPAETANISDTFVRGSVSVTPQRTNQVYGQRASISGNLTIITSRSFKYDLTSALIGGSVLIEATNADGTAKSAKIGQDMNVQGGLTAPSLKVRNISLLHPSSQSHVKDVDIANLRAVSCKISGPYNSVGLERGRVKLLEVSARSVQVLRASNLRADSVKIHGEIGEVELNGLSIGNALEFGALKAGDVSLLSLSARTVKGVGVTCRSIDFEGAQVDGELSFDRSQFSEKLAAANAVFVGAVSFARCALPGRVDFSGAHFQRGATFKVGSGGDIAADDAFKQIGEANFSGSRFDAGEDEVCANFDGRQTLEAANFESARFSGVPMFYECEFHENISFRGAVFDIEKPKTPYFRAVAELDWADFGLEVFKACSWPPRLDGVRIAKAWYVLRKPLALRRAGENHRLSRYERAYNALRQRFSEVGNAKYERQFHNYELRARRRRIDSDAPLVEGLVSWIYDVFSKYGQSISRPLIILFCSWLAFSVGYFLMAGSGSIDAALESIVFSARQVIKPFSAWSRDFALSASPAHVASSTTHPWIGSLLGIGSDTEVVKSTFVRLIATVQSFLSIVLLFLSGLAVRRTFGVG